MRFPSNCETLTIEVDLMRDLGDDCHSFQAFSSQSRGDAHRAMRREDSQSGDRNRSAQWALGEKNCCAEVENLPLMEMRVHTYIVARYINETIDDS